jgi:hypothetical protein
MGLSYGSEPLTTLRKAFDQFGYLLLQSAKNLIAFPQSYRVRFTYEMG